jgi:hypothetical protein
MTVAIIKNKVEIYAGDEWKQDITFTRNNAPIDLSYYETWAAQWRVTESSPNKVDLTVDSSNAKTGVIRLKATGDQTRSMLGPGVIDVQVTPGPNTLIKFYVNTEEDVTR